MDSKIVCFCLIFLQCSVQIHSLVCPRCIDFRYKFVDMPDISERQMERTLAKLSDILCRTNHKDTFDCNIGGVDYTSKCMDVFSTIVIKGIEGVGDNAGMKIETVNRGCTPRPKDEPDKCVDFSDIDGFDSTQLEQQLRVYSSMFNTVTLNGQICYNSTYTEGYQQPLQKASANWLDSLANRVHVSNVLYVISIVFSIKIFA